MMYRCQSTAAGFTLVEIQIAMVLLVLIVLVGYSSLHLAARSWHTVTAVSERIDNERLVSQFLRRQIEQVVPLLLDDGNNNTRLLFEGGPDAIEYVGRLPAHRGGGGLHLLNLSRKNGALVMTHRSLAHGYQSLDSSDTTTVLLDNIERIEFAYYGRTRPDAMPAWYPDWRNRMRPPELVRLTIVPATGAVLPSLTIPVQAKVQHGRPEFRLSHVSIARDNYHASAAGR